MSGCGTRNDGVHHDLLMMIHPDSGRYAGVRRGEQSNLALDSCSLPPASSFSRIQCIPNYHYKVTTNDDAERQGPRGYDPLDFRKGHFPAARPGVDAAPETKAYSSSHHPCLDRSLLDSYYL